MSAGRTPVWTVTAAAVLVCAELAVSSELPRTDTVLVPVPFGQLEKIRWLIDPDTMSSTCGQFKAYVTNRTVDRVAGRWYTVYASNVPPTTSYCSQLTNLHEDCGCFGIDFTTAMQDDLISFVMFSTDSMSASYELAVASLSGKYQLNMNQIVLRSFVVHSNAKISGKGAYIVPNAAVVDTDDFNSYMIMLVCREMATKPIIIVLVNALPMSDNMKYVIRKYLKSSGLDQYLQQVDHSNCNYAQNIVNL